MDLWRPAACLSACASSLAVTATPHAPGQPACGCAFLCVSLGAEPDLPVPSRAHSHSRRCRACPCSGAGLHVGHPEGYTATDIVSRYKRMRGYNVLHPMGWDAFGLPAEQYAIQTGTHPSVTTDKNIGRFREQVGAACESYVPPSHRMAEDGDCGGFADAGDVFGPNPSDAAAWC